MARCPNCARRVHFWRNYSGYCSKECRTDSTTSCPNCGKVGLYKHARLGCCSEECRYWYVAGLLGYDKDALLTPAWDKIVYHVRLPSTSAEISSLQLDELEYDRAVDTVLVVAAPPWMLRSKVLAELPYDRFDNAAWQHLWADGTLTEEELFTFHRMCYEDDLLCQKIGEHVYAKLRQPAPANGALIAGPSYADGATMAMPASLLATTRPMALPQATLTQARIAAPASASAAPHAASPADFVASVRGVFEERGYTVAPGVAENTLVLQRGDRIALAAHYYHRGMVDVDGVRRAFAAANAAGATQAFVVTNGHFTLQAEDFAAAHPLQLIDGDELAELMGGRSGLPAVSSTAPDGADNARENGHAARMNPAPSGAHSANGANGTGRLDGASERTEPLPAVSSEEGRVVTAEARPIAPREAREGREQRPTGISFPGKMAPVDAEIVGGEGTA